MQLKYNRQQSFGTTLLKTMIKLFILIIVFIAIYMEKNSLIKYFQDVGIIITII